MDNDLLGRQACGFRGHRLNARHRLAADPDFARILAKVHRAIHRLHRRVGEERNLIGGLDLGSGARHCLFGVTDVLRHRARAKRCLIELTCDRVGGQSGVRAFVPFDLERGQTFLRGAHMVRHDGDGVIKPDDLAHTVDGLSRYVVQALHAPAEHWRLHQRGDLHAGRANVDTVDCGPVDLCRCIEPPGGRADQLEIFR